MTTQQVKHFKIITMTTQEVKHVKCPRCKCWRKPLEFLNAKGRKLKTCAKCRDYDKNVRDIKKKKKLEEKKRLESTCKHGKKIPCIICHFE
jgi:hypothetical protein